MTLYVKIYVHFSAHLDNSLLNTYWSKKYFKQKLQRRKQHTLYIPYNFSVKFMVYIIIPNLTQSKRKPWLGTEDFKIKSVFYFNVEPYKNKTSKYILDKFYVHLSFLF
jgi:hypothetical protein